MTDEAPCLPEGAGCMPQWWLQCTPHDVMEEDEYEAKVKREADERDEAAIAEAEAALQELSDQQNAQQDEESDDNVNSTKLAKAFLATSKENECGEVGDKTPAHEIPRPGSRDVTDEIESKRANLKPVQTKAPKSLTTSETVMVGAIREAPFTAETISPGSTGKQSPVRSPASVDTMRSFESTPSPTRRKTFTTTFTGVSPFDFAMQQRALEKERREKEREARASLAHHHAQQASSDKASELKAISLEQKKKKKEAEEALKSFKNVSMGTEYAKASELKQLNEEQKRKKREAEAIQRGYKDTS